jgi:tetratricopeptide (TPR) repeat protein
MSIKHIYFFLLISIGCQKLENRTDPFAKLTEVERDSAANQYNEMSDYMLQPSDKHRILKDTALMLAPKNIEIRQVLSYSYKKRGEHIRAMEILNEAVSRDVAKGSIDGLQYRAWSLLYYYRDYEGSISDIDQLLAMNKQKYSICWGEPCGLLKGQALYKLGKYQEAIATFDTVLTEEVKRGFKAEDNYLVHFYKGMCYHKMGNYDLALKNYDLVLHKDENFTEAIFQSGLVHLAMNEKTVAKRYFEKALYWVKKGKKMGEPYFERFDEVFEWQIIEAQDKIKKG